MDFMNKASKPVADGQTVTPNRNLSDTQAQQSHANETKGTSRKHSSFLNITSVILLFSVTLLVVAVIGFIMNYRQNDESRYVATNKMQAVFLNGGQVYFGKIRALNNKYVGLTDIYYLRVNQQVQPKQGEQAAQDISLVKLGCELHGPQDQMLINRDQVVFWENLEADGKVAKAVESYKQSNPNGQKNCETNSQQSTPTTNNQQQSQAPQQQESATPQNQTAQ